MLLFLILIIGWCILLVICWPAAVVVGLLFLVLGMVYLVIRLTGKTIGGVFALVRAAFRHERRPANGSGPRT
jgi:hypothetical protein